MKGTIGLLVLLAFLILPFLGHAAPPPKQFDWYGGVKYANEVFEGKTLSEISAIAAHQAVFYDLPADYRTADGRMVIHVNPRGYDHSKDCAVVVEKIAREQMPAMNRPAKVCLMPEETTVPQDLMD